MKLEELAELLELAEKHPRVASLTMGDVTLTFAGPGEPVVAAPEPAELELPDGVPDPRKRLAEIHRKYQAKAPS